eukprot:TRINITY_DN1065_c0_g2_i1.p1 TRINITY_DN1065_c0_g2~~TRINITY_DN1065_c0_g2_i1.p1  ORF type:complete len:175 (+),score=69.04 TRINITY_DN1065_c0_g2_i1:90-614(+)
MLNSSRGFKSLIQAKNLKTYQQLTTSRLFSLSLNSFNFKTQSNQLIVRTKVEKREPLQSPIFNSFQQIRSFGSKNSNSNEVIKHVKNYKNGTIALAATVVLSAVYQPFEIFLIPLLAYHTHFGMTHIINDYVPPNNKTLAFFTYGLLGILAVIGLFNASIYGPGILKSILQLWA